jgi:hypothetical protein
MALLCEIATARTITLEPEHTVGRALTCSLRLEPVVVSAQHALIRHDGHGWVLRDLASLNGTWLDGRRIQAGQEQALRKGQRMAFGSQGAEWEVTDDSAPAVMVIPLDDGAPIVIQGHLLALPSADDPRAMVYRGMGDSWMLEEGDAPAVTLANLRVFHCAGRAWRFSCPDNVRATTRTEFRRDILLGDLTLEFIVSLDEEHVAVRGRYGDRVVELGERVYHYLLLTLARARLEDARNGVPEASCGWVDVEALCRNSTVTRGQINVDVFRVRQHFIENAVLDGVGVIERRPGQLRISTGHVTISRH